MVLRHCAVPRRGGALIQFAAVAPVVFVFLFAIIEYGRFVMLRQLIKNAAREGCRQAASNSPFIYSAAASSYVPHTLTTADIQNTVITYLAGQQLLNSTGGALVAGNISVYRANPVNGQPMTDNKGSNWTGAAFGESIAVSVSAQYKAMLPGLHFLAPTTPITFVCIMRSEASQ